MSVMRRRVVVGLAVVAAVIICALGAKYFLMRTDGKKELKHQNVVVSTEENSESVDDLQKKLASLQIILCGFDDATISEDTVVELKNSEENDRAVLIKYVITNEDSGEEIFETDLIPWGKSVSWKPELEKGVYKISFNQYGYYNKGNGEYIELTGGSNTVTYTVE